MFRGDDSNVSSLLQPVAEEDEAALGFEELPPPARPEPPREQMSSVAQLGMGSPPDNPLQEKKLEPNVAALPVARAGAMTAKGRVFHPEPKKLTAKEKGKGKAIERGTIPGHPRVKTSAGVEKENGGTKQGGKVFSAPTGILKVSPPGAGAGEVKKVVAKSSAAAGASVSRARLAAKLPPQAKGGPRRVLVDSVEAPAIGKGWRG